MRNRCGDGRGQSRGDEPALLSPGDMVRIATFNVQNLRLRHVGGALRLDGARNHDEDGDAAENAILDRTDRTLTARLIVQADADIIALQEVFDQDTLDYFHDGLLAPRGVVYPYRYCLEGNDGRSSDVAVMSRRPLDSVRSHARLAYAEIGAAVPPGISAQSPVFRRDCLAVQCGALWLFICHFKAPAEDAASALIRQAEARAVRHIVERSMGDPWRTPWLALGDFNAHDAAGERDLAPLTQGFAIDLGARAPSGESWTFFEAQARLYSRPDRIFAALGLGADAPHAAPHIVRSGMARCAEAYQGERLARIGHERPHASDHALLWIEI